MFSTEDNRRLKEKNVNLKEDYKILRKAYFANCKILQNVEDAIDKNEALLPNSIKNILIEALQLKSFTI